MKRLIFILLPILVASCQGAVLPKVSESLVVEGWIDAGGPPVVMLTTSVVPSEEFMDLNELYNHVLKWAKVTVSDGETSVVLMGKPTDMYDVPYIYTTAWMDGVPGKTYTLTVEYEDYYATAVTTIPSPEALKSLRYKSLGDDGYGVEAVFEPVPTSFYRFFTRSEKNDNSYIPSFLGVFSGNDLTGEATVSINPGRTIYRRDYISAFEPGDKVHVKFCTIDRPCWQYWSEFEEVSSMSGSPIFPVRFNIAGNVNGALGYWAGYGASWYEVDIPQ